MTTEANNPFETQSTSNAYDAVDKVYRKSALGVVGIYNPSSKDEDAYVVDLGAGTGISSEVLISTGLKNFCVVEPSAAMIEHAKNRLGDKATYIQATAEEMYQAFNKDVDLVYALNCIHLFPDLAKSFAGIAATLKRGGKFIFNITAPSFSFGEISDIEKEIYQANIDFYKSLNKLSSNTILEKTVELLEENLAGHDAQMFNKDTLSEFLKALNFKVLDSQTLEIEASIDYQKNIWRMMAMSFVDDEAKVEALIDLTKVPGKMLVKQAVFVAENLN